MLPRNPVAKPDREPAGFLGNVVRLPLPEPQAGQTNCVRGESQRIHDLVFDRYAPDVERILYRILGPDSELADLLHDVLIVAITSIDSLRDEGKVRSWLVGIAVHKARKLIRRRKVRKLIKFVAPSELPDYEAATATAEVSDALRETYRVLAQLPTDDRIAFSLRQIDGMELSSIAQVTRVSVATVKRRVSRAQRMFVSLARQNDTLAEWLERGTLEP
jgi:RNA polymerase sigma-70 factor (ECF subfamily)